MAKLLGVRVGPKLSGDNSPGGGYRFFLSPPSPWLSCWLPPPPPRSPPDYRRKVVYFLKMQREKVQLETMHKLVAFGDVCLNPIEHMELRAPFIARKMLDFFLNSAQPSPQCCFDVLLH